MKCLNSVFFNSPTQSVSALVQPLGVGAEYLNSSLVQVSYHVYTHVHTWWSYADPKVAICMLLFFHLVPTAATIYANMPSISPYNVIHILSVCFLSKLVLVLKWAVVFVYMTFVFHSDLYFIFICCVVLLFCCCSCPFSPQGPTKFHIVFPSPCLIQSSIRWSHMYRTWRKRTWKTR